MSGCGLEYWARFIRFRGPVPGSVAWLVPGPGPPGVPGSDPPPPVGPGPAPPDGPIAPWHPAAAAAAPSSAAIRIAFIVPLAISELPPIGGRTGPATRPTR